MFTLILFVYFVTFTDKPVQGEPALSPRAVEQRAKWAIETDELDFPVSAVYLDSLRAFGVEICHTSRWFNGATVKMSDDQAAQVSQWSFVSEVEMTRDNTLRLSGISRHKYSLLSDVSTLPSADSMMTDAQLALFNLPTLHAAGFEGQGILMTVCDGGFTNADSLPCFRQSQELGHFDFTDTPDGFYGVTGFHGVNCLSTISAIDSTYYGAATQADYYLMRSEEMLTESPKEMDNLVAAIEKADSLGVNVFSASLGYWWFDNDNWTLPKTAIDGKTTRVSRAARIAARKGMLLCIAAGNEGAKTWQFITVPGDADSILTVGAVGTDSIIGDFSGYGTSADGRIKPDVCAVGVQAAVIEGNGTARYANGTSFATPLLAGLAASLWSALPDENAMQIRERIIRSADRYLNPDSTRYGYGIPDAWKAYTMTLPEAIDPWPMTNDQSVTKVLRNGVLYIRRGEQVYTVMGGKVE